MTSSILSIDVRGKHYDQLLGWRNQRTDGRREADGDDGVRRPVHRGEERYQVSNCSNLFLLKLFQKARPLCIDIYLSTILKWSVIVVQLYVVKYVCEN